MSSPELFTAYGVAGLVIAIMMLTALKIVRGAGAAPAGQRPSEHRTAKSFRLPLAPTRR